MRFIRSLREGDFDLHVQVCDELGDWAFAFDRPNYSRALPLYVKDMVQLQCFYLCACQGGCANNGENDFN